MPPSRPAWLIPSIAAAGVALLLALNIGLYVAFVGLGGKAEKDRAERVEPVPVDSPGLGSLATAEPERAKAKPAEATPPNASTETTKAKPVTPAKVPVTPTSSAEEIPDRVMNSAEIVQRYEQSVAWIKGKKGSGTGFVARSGIVATNSHVIDGERVKDLEVHFPSAPERLQGPYPAKLLYQDKDRDLALLGVATDLPPVRVAENYKIRKGEDVIVIGSPGVGGQLTLKNAVSRGIVSSMTKLNDHSFLQLSIPINPGNSGGPAFDPKGRVIGVVTLKTTRQEALAFAVPAEDLLSALDTAGSVSGADPGDGSRANPGRAPTLSYAFKQGQTYAYSVEVLIDSSSIRTTLSGTSIYRVKAVNAEGITLAHKAWLLTTKRDRDGKVIPGGVSGPTQSNEVELKVNDKGYLVNISAATPLFLLGDFAMLMIEPLPDDPTASWDDSQSITLREVEQTPGSVGGPKLGLPGINNRPRGLPSRPGSRSRIAGRQPVPAPPPPQTKVTLHEASEETKYNLGALEGDRAPIRKSYLLATREMVGGDPRLKMTGEGTLSFDVKAGIPVALNYKLQVVEIAGNVTLKLPIAVSCKLLEGKEREVALKPPVYVPSAMNKVGNGDVSRLLADLKVPDNGKRREALRALFDAAPLENRRGEVSRALDRSASDKDQGVRSDAIKALGVWGDGRSIDNLLATLRDPSFGFRDELFEAIGRISPTEEAAGAIIPWLATEQGRAAKALRAIGAPAEAPLLRAVEGTADLKVRQEACRLLKEIGTARSVPVLEKLAGMKQDGEFGRNAADAIKNINRRHPGDEEWATILAQARSSERGKARDVAERLGKIDPVESRRSEVARALETLVNAADDGTQAMAIRGLGSWGDERSRSVLVERLEKISPSHTRELIEALGQLGPDDRAARAMARRFGGMGERKAVIEAFTKMGPAAENAALEALKNVGQDIFARNDLCKFLGHFGTEASLPALRELATSRSPEDPKASLKELESRLGGQGLREWVADLKAIQGSRRELAIQRIAYLPRTTPGINKAELARTLDGLWNTTDNGLKKWIGRAVVAWGDDKSADALVDYLSKPDERQWDEALAALVELRPDARTANLLAARLTQNRNRVVEIGRTMARLVEVPLLATVQGDADPRSRTDACWALGQLGTPASLAALQGLAGRSGDAEIAREAQDALNEIKSRQ